MKIQVDPTKCQAYGRCIEIGPDLFELDDFGFAVALEEGVVAPGNEDRAREAVRECPARAIMSDHE